MAASFGHFFGRIFRVSLSQTLYPEVRVKQFYRTACTPSCCRRGDGRSERDYTKLVLFCHTIYDQGIATENRWQGIKTCPPGRDAEKIRQTRKKGLFLLYCVLNLRNVYCLISTKYAPPLPTVKKEERTIEKTWMFTQLSICLYGGLHPSIFE